MVDFQCINELTLSFGKMFSTDTVKQSATPSRPDHLAEPAMPTIDRDFLNKARDFAVTLAHDVRPLSRRHFRQPLGITLKADASPVTCADRAVEAAIRQAIRERYPEHGLLGEEEGGCISEGWTWVVDPIDGTKSFICGVPLYGTLIALLQEGRPILGVIDMPVLDECWVGDTSGTHLNGVPARTKNCTELAKARLFATSPEQFAGQDAGSWLRVAEAVAMHRYGGDCYLYGLLASGHCDLVVEAGLQPYDVMALVPVVHGAGGVISDWQGEPVQSDFDGRVVAAATPELHRKAVELLARV